MENDWAVIFCHLQKRQFVFFTFSCLCLIQLHSFIFNSISILFLQKQKIIPIKNKRNQFIKLKTERKGNNKKKLNKLISNSIYQTTGSIFIYFFKD
jgi:hypothetical protein